MQRSGMSYSGGMIPYRDSWKHKYMNDSWKHKYTDGYNGYNYHNRWDGYDSKYGGWKHKYMDGYDGYDGKYGGWKGPLSPQESGHRVSPHVCRGRQCSSMDGYNKSSYNRYSMSPRSPRYARRYM